MRWQELVLTELRKSFDFTASTMELYPLIDAVSKNERGAARSALSRLTRKGIIERISRGTYRLLELFRLFRHTKRVVETHRKNAQRSYNLDIETTSEGFVPITAFENAVINRAKHSRFARGAARKMELEIITRIEKIVNPQLIDETMRILATEGMFIGFGLTEIEFNVTGSEFKRELSPEYDPNHDVEVILINDVGQRYVFVGNFHILEHEFE